MGICETIGFAPILVEVGDASFLTGLDVRSGNSEPGEQGKQGEQDQA